MVALAVMASGMVTALGFNAPATLAALRAGISGIQETPWMDHGSGARLYGAKVPLPHWWEGVGNLANLISPAIYECLQASTHHSPESIPLLLGVAAPERPGRFLCLDEDLISEVQIRLGLPQHPLSKIFPMDQTGCALALIEAHELIRRAQVKRVIVAGVDSFLHQPTLNVYIEQRRIVTPNNSNGFFPGEAGCAVLIGEAGTHNRDELCIHGYGVAHESANINGTEPLRAKGLTDAIKKALDNTGVALKDIAYRLTDLSGEHYKFKEATFSAGRLNTGERDAALDLWHPIEFLGEIGAAILPCLLAQAMHADHKGYAPGPLALCHVGNDSGSRAAFIVGRNRRG